MERRRQTATLMAATSQRHEEGADECKGAQDADSDTSRALRKFFLGLETSIASPLHFIYYLILVMIIDQLSTE